MVSGGVNSLRKWKITLAHSTIGHERSSGSYSRVLVVAATSSDSSSSCLGTVCHHDQLATLLLGLGLLPTSKKRRDAWDAMRAFRDGTLRPDAFYWNMECNSRSLVRE